MFTTNIQAAPYHITAENIHRTFKERVEYLCYLLNLLSYFLFCWMFGAGIPLIPVVKKTMTMKMIPHMGNAQ